MNDKQITVNDTFPVDVWHGERFKLRRFILINKDGVDIEYQGVWLAVDGGYQKIACFIDPMHNRYSFNEVAFSEWLESVRKDVECAFGILKIRFRFLRGFVIYHDPLIIEYAFKTAAMLHNMLLDWDGLDDFNWENTDPDGDIDEPEVALPVHVDDEELFNNERPDQFIQRQNNRNGYVHYLPGNYDLIRSSIMVHWNHQYSLGNVKWPNRFKENLKKAFPTQRNDIVIRLNEEYERVLYVQASTLRALDPTTNIYTIMIGDGLFSRRAYDIGDHIADYNGELISVVEGDQRDARGHGGYMIYINQTTYMDCFVNCMNFRCKASKANSNFKAINTNNDGRGAIQNARIIVSNSSNGVVRVRLQAKNYIYMHTEIITNYGRGFRYPQVEIN